MMTVTFAVIYALGAMALGGMLVLFNQGGGYTVEVLWGNALGQSPWTYPGLLVIAPWGVLVLPFFATIAMVVVSAGVGTGMAVAVLLVVSLLRRRRASGRATSLGTAAGLTPVMITLVTLGACCSTTAAATAGVGLVAQVSGTSANNLLLNNWFLGVFQMVIVWVALLGQELVLRVYGGLFGLPTAAANPAYGAPKRSPRLWAGTFLRIGLLVGGVTWALSMLVEWTVTSPFSAPAALWFRWVVQYELLAFLAILSALFPRGTSDLILQRGGRRMPRVLRASLLVGGLTLTVGAPPPLAGWGIEGLGNELLALLGYSSSVGAVSPVFSPGLDLAFRWGVQYLLVGGFALAVALFPQQAFAPLRWTVGQTETADVSPGSPSVEVGPRPVSSPASAQGRPSREAESSRLVVSQGP